MKVKVEIRELSNSVTAAVEVETEDGSTSLAEAKRLFKEAQLFAAEQTMRKKL